MKRQLHFCRSLLFLSGEGHGIILPPSDVDPYQLNADPDPWSASCKKENEKIYFSKNDVMLCLSLLFMCAEQKRNFYSQKYAFLEIFVDVYASFP